MEDSEHSLFPEEPVGTAEGNRNRNPETLRRATSAFDYLRPQRWNWTVLSGRIDRRIREGVEQKLQMQQVRGLRYFLLDGLFSTVSENFFINYIALYALSFGATIGQVGLLTAVTNLAGTLSLFPGAYAAERTRNRKRLVLWTGGGVSRLALLALAAIPLATGDPGTALILIIIFNSIRSFMSSFANPAWTSIVADLVPGFIRGRYFGLRNSLMAAGAFLAAALAGWIIRHGNGFSGFRHAGYQAAFFIACITGLAGTFFFSRIPRSGISAPPADERRPGRMPGILSMLPFAGLVLHALLWNLSVQLAAPFFNVYLVNGLGAGMTLVGIATASSSAASLPGQYLFGRIMDRRGAIPLLLLTGLLIPLIPLLWMVVRAPWQVPFLNAFGGFLWAGYNMANFTLLLELSPEAQRPRAVALFQVAVFSSAVIGPALGGLLTERYGFMPVFAASGIGRFAALVPFLFVVVRMRRSAGGRPGG